MSSVHHHSSITSRRNQNLFIQEIEKNLIYMKISLLSKMSLLKLSLQQFINVPGLKALGLIFTNPSYLLPDYHLDNLSQLDFYKLKRDHKVECLVFDKDNTLSYCFVDEPHPSVVPLLETANEVFPKGVAILSNSAGTLDDENNKMAIASEKAIGLPVIRHRVKKPGCLPEVYIHQTCIHVRSNIIGNILYL